MSKSPASTDWRETRRRSARDAITEAAWSLVRDEGLAGLSLRDLAKRAGISTPTVYAYFESKNAIYDAMFAQAATDFADRMTQPDAAKNPREVLSESLQRFVDFCTSDGARFQLLFQRPMPDFEPSAVSLAPAIVAFDAMRARLALNGITDPAHIDMWTALTAGLVSQQVANDPGGDRWTCLIEELVGMFLAYVQPVRAADPPPADNPTKESHDHRHAR
jgi:AcrR family transcriptional regulator